MPTSPNTRCRSTPMIRRRWTGLSGRAAPNGRVPNANFAEYAVPVHADAPPVMDAIFVEEHDPHVNPLGVKGVGEIAMVGVAPAITNAIFHATGKRIRELPVTPDKLL